MKQLGTARNGPPGHHGLVELGVREARRIFRASGLRPRSPILPSAICRPPLNGDQITGPNFEWGVYGWGCIAL